MYRQIIDHLTSAVSTREIQRVSDGAVIPFNELNGDYQEYLQWLAAGNTPLPPDAA